MPAKSVHGGFLGRVGTRTVEVSLIRLQLGPPIQGCTTLVEVCGGRGCRAVRHRDTAGQVPHGLVGFDIVGPGIRGCASVHLIVRVEAVLVLEHRAVLDDARVRRAGLHCAPEHVVVPAVHEVAVHSVTRRVAVGEDEAPAVI